MTRRTFIMLGVALAAGCSTRLPAPVFDDTSTSGTGSSGSTSTAATTGGATSSTGTSSGTSTSSSGSDTGTDAGTTGAPGDPLEVLFVGNSYTLANDLPALVESVAGSLGHDVATLSLSMNGARFSDHLDNPAVAETLATVPLDVVVLQGQSYEMIHPDLADEAKTSGIALANLAHDAGVNPLFFETWARAEGHAIYREGWAGDGPAAMQALLHQAYQGLADAGAAELAPVGQAWMAAITADPTLPLYAADGAHPGLHGSYLSACVFVGILTRSSPVGASWPNGLEADDALALQEAAESVLP